MLSSMCWINDTENGKFQLKLIVISQNRDLMDELVIYIREAVDRKQENMRRRRRRDALRLQLVKVLEKIAENRTFAVRYGLQLHAWWNGSVFYKINYIIFQSMCYWTWHDVFASNICRIHGWCSTLSRNGDGQGQFEHPWSQDTFLRFYSKNDKEFLM